MEKQATNTSGNPGSASRPAASGGTDGAAELEAGGTVPLSSFLATAGELSLSERLVLVDQAIHLLEGFYVHLPLKRAMHAVDPVQRLRLLRHRMDKIGDETRFHAEMTAIFTSVRDLHTNYLLPSPYSRVVASLPFRIETCSEGGALQFIVAGTAGPMPDPAFQPGVAVTHWNGVPIERAVANAADKHAGSNPAARFSRGLAGLTQRPLVIVPAPDEEWVIVDYLGLDGAPRQTRFDWIVRGLPAQAGADPGHAAGHEAFLGYDLETHAIQQVRQALFAPHVGEAKAALEATGDPLGAVAGTDSTMPDVFLARSVSTSKGTFGYIRIWTFAVPNDQAFVEEFVRLARLLPAEGLIVDVRDNGGGLISAGERLLQTLTPRRIEPERLQFINTPLTEILAQANGAASAIDLSNWQPSISRSVETGAAFSCSFPITDPDSCNDIGQWYQGPVVLVTSARCYSTTDIFSAGFQDHSIGKVLGVDNNTGAGGANVWEHRLLLRLMSDAAGEPLPGSPVTPLPSDSRMRVAIRRTLRVGKQAGTELEDLGVVPDFEHQLTRNDILNGNQDLIERAASILAEMPRYRLDATAVRTGAKVRIDFTSGNLDRLDVAVADRPRTSLDIGDGASNVDLASVPSPAKISLRGYKDGQLVAARHLSA